MQPWKLTLKRREKIGVVLEGKFAVQTPNDMQLGRTFIHRIASDLDAFLDRVRVGTLLPRPFVKAAELAVGDADVRVVEVAVDVVIGRQPVLPAADRAAVAIAPSNRDATVFAKGPVAPSGPTQDGQPDLQGQPSMSSRVRSINCSCMPCSGSLKPMPPG